MTAARILHKLETEPLNHCRFGTDLYFTLLWATTKLSSVTVYNSNSRNKSAYRPPFSSQKTSLRRQLFLLSRKIKKLERRLDCQVAESSSQKVKLSLKQLQQRVDRLERKLRSKTQQGSLQLSTRSCLRFLIPEARHWHNIGILLGVPELTLESIEERYSGDSQHCVREMIKSWLKQTDPPPSWKELSDAIELYNPSLSKKIVKSAVNAWTQLPYISSFLTSPVTQPWAYLWISILSHRNVLLASLHRSHHNIPIYHLPLTMHT